jgi:hypothetical protein
MARNSSDAEVQRLLDEAAVRKVHLRYCRGIDRRDWELVEACYHPGAVEYHGPYNGDIRGFIAFAREALEACDSVTHFTGNQLVEIDGDTAWHEAYCRAYQRLKATKNGPALDLMINFRFIDRMEKLEGKWKIRERVVAVDSVRSDPVPGDAQVGPEWHRGRHDRTDPVYDRSVPLRPPAVRTPAARRHR